MNRYSSSRLSRIGRLQWLSACLAIGAPSVTVSAESAPGLVLAMGFDEGSGTTAYDSSGRGNHGTLVNASFVVGHSGTALSGTGSGGRVEISSSATDLRFTEAFTIEAWIRPTELASGWHQIIGRQYGTSYYDSWFIGHNGTTLTFAAGGASGGLSSPSPLILNQWVHVAGVKSGATERLYINGVQVASTSSATTPVPNDVNEVSIGAGSNGNPQWNEEFKGQIDDVRAYSLALTDAQIQADMDTPVQAANSPPESTISAPAGNVTITAGQSVNLAGSGSDPDGHTPLSYSWNFGAGSGIPDSIAQDPGSVVFSTPGSYTVSFTVADAFGLADPTPATRTVTVAPESVAGLAGWWKHDEGSGTTAGDASGNGYIGTLTGGATFVPNGRIEGAVDLDGVTGKITLGSAFSALVEQTDKTLALWALHESEPASGFRFISLFRGIGSGNGQTAFAIRTGFSNPQVMRWSYWNGSTVSDLGTTINAADLRGSWHHYALVQSGANVYAYLDGALVGSASNGAAATTTSPPNAVVGGYNTTAELLNGQVDDVRVYSRALTAGEVGTLYQEGQGLLAQAPVSLSADPISAPVNAPVTISASGGSGSGSWDFATSGGALSGTGDTRTFTSSSAGTFTVTAQKAGDGTYQASDTAEVLVIINTAANTAPTISSVANQSTTMGVTVGPLEFAVGDAETASSSLVLTKTSSNITLVPMANIELGGSDANRTVTVTPVAGQTGTTTITLTVSDGTLTAESSFTVTVSAPNTVPTISDITNQTTTPGVAVGPLSFVIGDAETVAGSLTLGRSSSDTTLVPTNNILFGGSEANRTVTVTPTSGQTGTATITLTVSDASGGTASTSFVLTVSAPPAEDPTLVAWWKFDEGSGTVASDSSSGGHHASLLGGASWDPGHIGDYAIHGNGTGGYARATGLGLAGYPFSISYWVKRVAQAWPAGGQVSLSGASSFYPVYLIAYNYDTTVGSERIGLWAGTGGSNLSDAAATIDGDGNEWVHLVAVFASNTDKRVYANGQLALTLTNNVPFGSTASTMYIHRNAGGSSPNYTAGAIDDLRVYDRSLTQAEIENLHQQGQGLLAQSAVSISADPTTALVDAPVTISASGGSGSGSWDFASTGGALNGTGDTRTFTSSSPGTFTITAQKAGDGTYQASDTAEVLVTINAAANTVPTISSVANQSTIMGAAVGPLGFTIGDAETAPSSLVLTKSSSNTSLVPTPNIELGGSGSTRTVTVTPAAGQTGTATITLTVSDGTLTAESSFTVTVSAPNTAPTISGIADQTTTPGVAVGPLSFTIGDAETVAGSLTLGRSSSHTTLVPANNIVLGGSGGNRTVTVTPASGQTGTATITLTVSDGDLTASTGFTLSVESVAASPTMVLPLVVNFETTEGYSTGPLDGQQSWIADGSVQVVGDSASAGSQSLRLDGGTTPPHARAEFEPAPGESVVFIDLFAKPVTSPSATTGSTFDFGGIRLAAVDESSQGSISVWSGDGAGGGSWQASGFAFDVDVQKQASNWQQLSVRIDYALKRWDFYANGEMRSADLRFENDATTGLTDFNLYGPSAGSARFDAVLIDFENPLFLDADKDGIDDAYEIGNGMDPTRNDRNEDTLDVDGLTNLQEYLLGIRANVWDTDGDGFSDGWEVVNEYDPKLSADRPLPPGYQLIIRTPNEGYFGINTATWVIGPVTDP